MIIMRARRVVTAHDVDGKSVFASDEIVEPVRSELFPGYEFCQLWHGEGPPHLPTDGTPLRVSDYFPAVGGFRFALFTIPANRELASDLDKRAAARELAIDLPGILDHHERGGGGMHTTPTVDFEVVLRGVVTLELDDGATVDLHPGDTVVQNGTRHRWLNRGREPATYAVFIVGAHHEGVGRQRGTREIRQPDGGR